MQTNLLWTGREYYSLENCLVNTTDTGTEINSVIVGKYGQVIYRVEYLIRTSKHWETLSFVVKCQHNNMVQHLQLESDGAGNWFNQGTPAAAFKGCMDIDIPLTPFTNTLPINRLQLAPHAQQTIRVVYIDLLEQQIKPVYQQYTRLSSTAYKYENIPNDFEATVQVDEKGFVVDYPSLFVRTASMESNYPSTSSPLIL